MDNADKIVSGLTHKEVALFLGDDLHIQNDENITTYNLVDEYAKTRHHRNFFVWLLLLACFFVVGTGTVTAIGILSHSHKQISINIDSFDDLNLRALLSSAGRAQSLYDTAVKNKLAAEESYENELSQAAQKRDKEFFTLQTVAKVASSGAIQKRRESIEKEYEESVLQIHEKYDSQLLEIDGEIEKYRKQLKKYESPELAHAQEAESTLDSTKQLHDLEMRAQADRYEKKLKELRLQLLTQQARAVEEQRQAVEEVRTIYQAKIDLLDPKAREQSKVQDQIIMEAGIKKQTATSALWKSVESLEFNESAYTAAFSEPSKYLVQSLKSARSGLRDLETVASRFKPIPMENSIKDYVPALVHQSYQIAGGLAEAGVKMQEEIEGLKSDVSSLKAKIKERDSLLDSFIAQNPCDGIIIGDSDSPSFHVYLVEKSRRRVSGEEGMTVHILNGNKAVADALLTFDGKNYIITQNVTAAGESDKKSGEAYKIKIGDRIKF